jgi:hypothetical protein
MGYHSKADLRFWQEAVFLHARRASGKTYEDSDYSVRMQHEGRRARFALGTPNRAGGRQQWLERVDAVPLEKVTPALVQKWKLDFLNRVEANPAAQRTARISVNSLLRQARSLFSPKRLQLAKVAGLRSPFEGVELEPRQSMRYRSNVRIQELVRQAMAELGPEELKVFLLASMAGLRRNEIDKLPWVAFNWDRGTLKVEVTEHFDAKSEHSIGEVDLDPEFLALFREFRMNAGGPFVIQSGIGPRPGAGYSHYRCSRIFLGSSRRG